MSILYFFFKFLFYRNIYQSRKANCRMQISSDGVNVSFPHELKEITVFGLSTVLLILYIAI